ncbi:MAG: L-glutamate gamma-semialdehyde dehydrogenase [Bacteroidales bacterium]|nr:L-glutamate gamma-semialdehyde dehydrogenase [Bacteroidales bacterium]MDD4575795.1 L-glutamate gamma-semialdehyde dehydrogenase [Bacteroidales bacterium]
MNNAIFSFPNPQNEPILKFAKGSTERAMLEAALKRQMEQVVEIPLIIGGKEVKTGNIKNVVMPHDHQHVIGRCHLASEVEVNAAIKAALEAKKEWENMSLVDRTSIILKVADLISTKYRYEILATTMLGQSKNPHQAEIDAACETIDFLRYNAYFASKIYADQPKSGLGQLNRVEYRPLEGFVFTISPFNFTAIASNLNMSVILMGNTTVWKPAQTSVLSNYLLMKIYKEAGMPDGVINFLPGPGATIGGVTLKHKDLAGIHFTGSSGTFNHLWKSIGENLSEFKSYPKIVGETGGKDFIFAHTSANPLQLATAITMGSFEYQGQKCSAASRSYIPKSIWNEVKGYLLEQGSRIKMGPVTDFTNFVNAVIDEKSFDNCMSYLNLAKKSSECEIILGGNGDKSVGYYIEPTIIVTTNPDFASMKEEIFGPIITIYIYNDEEYEATLHLCDNTSPYALTGAIFATEKYAVIKATEILRNAAGNFYINDKPTGAMVGMQPFGGARASGTNDKAGGPLNLIRWVSPRTIKETFNAPTDFVYDFMK